MTLATATPARAPVEEIRLAVVLNGGVSLAVWMGGVVQELNRLPRRGASTARRWLAAAQALPRAADRAASGDEFFLEQLDVAMKALSSAFEPTGRPVDLTLAITLLDGVQNVTVDVLGQRIPDIAYDGRFRFSHDQLRSGGAARALALAARCSAGFPVAFEPRYVPVDVPADDRRDRPDMARYASWSEADQAATVDRSRFTVDRGLLANTPTRYALSAIARMPPADGPTRRVMPLVHPHAPLEAPETPARPDAPPTVIDTLAGLLTALTGQGSRNFAEEIDAHNRNAVAWRDGRSDVLAALTNRESLHTLVHQLWPHYRRLRVRQVRNEWVAHSPTPLLWSAQRIRSAVSTAFDTWSHGHGGALPFLPPAEPGTQPDAGPGWPWGLGTAIAVVDEVGDLARRALGVAREVTTVALLHQVQAAVVEARAELDAPGERRIDVGVRALAAFDAAGIGRESLEQEATSDQLIRTTATAAATTSTLLDSDRSGLGRVAKPVTRTLRGAMLLPNWVITGLTAGGAAARALTFAGLTVGGVLLTLSLLGLLGSASPAGALLGVGAVLCALGYAAMRSGTLLYGLVLLAPVSPLVAVGLTDVLGDTEEATVRAASTVGGVLALVLALVLSPACPLRCSARQRPSGTGGGGSARTAPGPPTGRARRTPPRSGCSACSPRWPVLRRSPTQSSGPAGSARTRHRGLSSAGRLSSDWSSRPGPGGGCGCGCWHRCRTPTARGGGRPAEHGPRNTRGGAHPRGGREGRAALRCGTAAGRLSPASLAGSRPSASAMPEPR